MKIKFNHFCSKQINFTFSCFIFFSIIGATAQDLPCGNEDQPYSEELNRRAILSEIKNSRLEKSMAETLTYIAVKPHLFGKDDATGYANETSVNRGLALLNKEYKTMNVVFYFSGTSFNYYPNSKFYSHSQTATEMDNFHFTNGVNNAINVYVSNDVKSGGNIVAGYSFITPTRQISNRMAIANEYISNATVMNHEFGHYLGLQHTFRNSNHATISSRELVTRNSMETTPRLSANCKNMGDYVCDTPSDPHGRINLANCSYTETIVDANGDLFIPSLNNIMSYFVYCNRNVFSTGQFDRMKEGVLIVTNPNKNFTLNAPETLQTAASTVVATNLGGDYVGNIEINWKDNSNSETGYIIESSDNKNGPFTAINGVAANITKLTIPAEPKKTYYFRIKPSNSKSNYSAVSNAVTISGLCSNRVGQSCLLDLDPALGAARIESITLNRATTVILKNENSGCSIGGLGNYYNTISAKIHPGDVIDFVINSKSGSPGYFVFGQLYADWNQDGDFDDKNEIIYSNETRVLRNITGNFSVPTDLVKGSYRMRVVLDSDSRKPTSCVARKGEIEDYKLIYDSALAASNFDYDREIYCYPNPTTHFLNIKIPKNSSPDKVIIYDIHGRKVFDQKTETNQINVNHLLSGIYFVELLSGEVKYRSKFVKL